MCGALVKILYYAEPHLSGQGQNACYVGQANGAILKLFAEPFVHQSYLGSLQILQLWLILHFAPEDVVVVNYKHKPLSRLCIDTLYGRGQQRVLS